MTRVASCMKVVSGPPQFYCMCPIRKGLRLCHRSSGTSMVTGTIQPRKANPIKFRAGGFNQTLHQKDTYAPAGARIGDPSNFTTGVVRDLANEHMGLQRDAVRGMLEGSSAAGTHSL